MSEQQTFSYLTVNQFCDKHPAFKVGGVRDKIFHSETNGLAKSGAIIRDGRKVLINETKWFQRLEAQNQGSGK
ncbi:MAG: hypothetical protein ABL903_14145 [Methylococcales bacterium]